MNRNQIPTTAMAIVTTIMVMWVISSEVTRFGRESYAANWQNNTEWAYSLGQNNMYVQISNQVIVQGYVPWCVKAQNGNRMWCGYLQAVNFTEVFE